MSRKLNPYHLWLGLPAEVVSPDFFQLLGVSTNATDDKQIAASARAEAQKLLDRLKELPVKRESEKAIRDKLRSRIVTAHKTISDPAKRKQYLAALASKKAAASSTSASAPPKPPTNKPTTPPPENAAPNIPQAIPLAMPLDSSPPQRKAKSEDAGRFDALEDEEVVRVRPVRVRGKRSSIVPIVVSLLVITVIGGLVSLLAKYNNIFDVLAKTNQGIGTPTVNAIENMDPSLKLAADADANPEPLKVPKNFQMLSDAQRQASNNASTKNKSAKTTLAEKNAGGGITKAGRDSPEEAGAKKETMSNDEANAAPTDAPEASAADKAASATVARVAANIVRQALLRHDIPAAKKANQQIEQLVGGFGLPDAITQASLEKEHITNAEMIDHLEVFLSQLQSAAVEMPGGQDIKVGKLVMSLVDASPTNVTLRRAGRNDVVPYTDLPVSVAIALGDQGSKESMPKWNMAKAAVLTMHARHNPALLEQVKPLLRQCISDGYDDQCEVISAYGDISWQQRYLTEERPADPTSDEVDQRLKDFRADNEYKNPIRVKSDFVDDILEMLLIELPESPEQRRAYLSEAIGIATMHKRFDAVLAATGELYTLCNLENLKDTVVTPINRCMRSDMSATQARHLIHTIIGLTKQLGNREGFDQKSKDKLTSHAQTLVEEFSFSELAPKVRELSKH